MDTIPRDGNGLAQLRRDVIEESNVTDLLSEHLEYRVARLEEITAARWPRRWLLRARLGRKLRASVRHFPGQSFGERRMEAAAADWLAQR